MRRLGIVAGILVAVAGAIWVAQGLNLAFAPRSFMTADRTWVVIGLVGVLAGIAIAVWSARRA